MDTTLTIETTEAVDLFDCVEQANGGTAIDAANGLMALAQTRHSFVRTAVMAKASPEWGMLIVETDVRPPLLGADRTP